LSTRIRGNEFRLLTTLDDFLEGGDANLLLEELAAKQQQSDMEERNNSSATKAVSFVSRSGWKLLPRFQNYQKRHPHQSATAQPSSPSPVEMRTIRGRRNIYIKRDDLLKLPNSGISGNKARKMWSLDQLGVQDFPACLVSYGGPQSNSMLALAAIVNCKNREALLVKEEHTASNDKQQQNKEGSNALRRPIRFVYYTKTLPRLLRNQPNGNLFRALSLGMELVQVTHQEYTNMFEGHCEDHGEAPMGLDPPVPGDSLWVPQGGAFSSAQAGVDRLVQEIYSYWQEHGDNRPLSICVPGGTCTTALLLHHGLKRLQDELEQEQSLAEEGNTDGSTDLSSDTDIQVVVIPCVGDGAYARRQMMSLSVQVGADAQDIPTILQAGPEQPSRSSEAPKRYFTFGQPNKEILETFQELRDECDLVVDLIYGAPSFAIILRHFEKEWESARGGETRQQQLISPDLTFDPNQPLAGREVMYVHSGGLEGINSQLLRYKYEGMIDIQDVQLPGRSNN
jgi:1-aminocyclopropane-1-carboxylate deaminase/D-cysteine desulfhydrase-like pyridoxal-dependent ACC family enzyme